MTRVPFLDLGEQYRQLRQNIDAAVSRVLASGQFILGAEVAALEKEVGAFLGVAAERVVGVSNGSDALVLALRAAGVEPGDEVVTSPFTFVATGTSILRAGGRPRFVDIDPDTFLLQTDAALDTGARCVVPIHLFGRACELLPFAEAGRHVVEDAAQAIGADLPGGGAAGALPGGFGCFSLYPTKNLGAAGDAGLVVAPDADRAARVRRIRTHGQARKYFAEEPGYNMRMDAIQAAIVRVKLRCLASWNDRRRRIAHRYSSLLSQRLDPALVRLPQDAAEPQHHVWHAYVIRAERRDALRDHLREADIATQVFYPHPLHQMPAFEEWAPKGGLENAEQACRDVLALPIYPEITDELQDRVVAAVVAFYR